MGPAQPRARSGSCASVTRSPAGHPVTPRHPVAVDGWVEQLGALTGARPRAGARRVPRVVAPRRVDAHGHVGAADASRPLRRRPVPAGLVQLGRVGRHDDVAQAGGDDRARLRSPLVPHARNRRLAVPGRRRPLAGQRSAGRARRQQAPHPAHLGRDLGPARDQRLRRRSAAVSRRSPASAPTPRCRAEERVVVHNLGCPGTRLAMFCRSSAGDPLALLDEIEPDLVTVLFSNDVVLDDPDRFRAELVRLVERVRGYADVLLIAPYEQCPQRAGCRCRYGVDPPTERGPPGGLPVGHRSRRADDGLRVPRPLRRLE